MSGHRRKDRGRRIPASSWLCYVGGRLCADSVPLDEIAAAHGTPCWVYSARALDAAYRAVDGAFRAHPRVIAYAIKANGLLAILARLGRLGAGADIVSGGELACALRAGMSPDRIVYSGAGKRADEIEAAVAAGIRGIHLEVAAEVEVIEAAAARLGREARVMLRVNPDVRAGGHRYVATGITDTKFGLDFETARALVPRIRKSARLRLRGIAIHVGSQLTAARPVVLAVERAARLLGELRAGGHPLDELDVGGGIAIDYGEGDRPPPGPDVFARAVERGLRNAGFAPGDLTLVLEPGRGLVGDAGALLTRILYVKRQPLAGGEKRRFVIVDAGMNELVRPALYGAHHAVMPVRERPARTRHEPADLVGPVCETADFFAEDRPLPLDLAPGELVLVRGAGAYGRSMSSQYNARPRCAEVMVGEQERPAMRCVRARESIDDLWRGEAL